MSCSVNSLFALLRIKKKNWNLKWIMKSFHENSYIFLVVAFEDGFLPLEIAWIFWFLISWHPLLKDFYVRFCFYNSYCFYYYYHLIRWLPNLIPQYCLEILFTLKSFLSLWMFYHNTSFIYSLLFQFPFFSLIRVFSSSSKLKPRTT